MSAAQQVLTPSQGAISGINNFFRHYVGLSDQDRVLVCFWRGCINEAAWLVYALEEYGNDYKTYSFAHRDDDIFASKVNALCEKLSSNNMGKLIVLVCEQDSLSFTPYLKNLRHKGVHVWRLMNTSAHLFEEALAVEPKKLRNINANLIKQFLSTPQKKLQIKNELGTDLQVEINNEKYSWISTYGMQKKEELIILPTGEVNTYPANISGTFVAFGALHANIPIAFDTRLVKNPVSLQIDEGIVTSFQCKNKKLEAFLSDLLAESHMNRVGEFGIGTNIGLSKFVPENSHINERFPGVHLGVGMHLQQQSIMDYKTEVHIDFISPYGIINILDESININLKELSSFAKKELHHPVNISAEDGG